MLSLRNVGSWLFRNRFTVVFGTATIVTVLMSGFEDRRQMTPWPFGRVPILTAGCPATGCACLDDCVSGSNSGSSGRPASGSASVPFEPNIGQTDSRYSFIASGAGHTVRLAPPKQPSISRRHGAHARGAFTPSWKAPKPRFRAKGWRP